MKRVNTNYIDKQAKLLLILSKLTQSIPSNNNWFGLSAQDYTASPNIAGKSTSASLMISIAKSISNLFHYVAELAESIFLTKPGIPGGALTDAWIQHLKNTYSDYYGDFKGFYQDDPDKEIVWEIDLQRETPEAYKTRIEAVASKLINLFTPKGITTDEVKKAIEASLGLTVELSEPWEAVTPYPSSEQYKITRFSGETDTAYQSRLLTYNNYFTEKLNYFDKATAKFSKQPNTVYPTEFYINLTGEDEQTRIKRTDLLKSELGRYTSSEDLDKPKRKYFDIDQYGGVVNINIKTTNPSIDLGSLLLSLRSIKAAGVRLKFNLDHSFEPILETFNASIDIITTRNNNLSEQIIVLSNSTAVIVWQL